MYFFAMFNIFDTHYLKIGEKPHTSTKSDHPSTTFFPDKRATKMRKTSTQTTDKNASTDLEKIKKHQRQKK